MPALVYPAARATAAAADVMAARSGGVDGERRRLFDDLLVPSLDRALALDKRHDGAVLVAEELDFDVARADQAPLQVDGRVAECAAGFRPRRGDRGGEVARIR